MQEKDLKIKQKQSRLKTKEGINNGQNMKNSLLKEKLKADYFRTKTRQPSEKETSEVSNQSEEMIVDTTTEVGIFVADRFISDKRNKKKYRLNKGSNEESNGQRNIVEHVWNPEENKQAFKKKYAVEKGRKIKEKQYPKPDVIHMEPLLLQEKQHRDQRFVIRGKYRSQKVIEQRKLQKKHPHK